MIDITAIAALSDDKLKAVHASLKKMAASRAATKHNKRTKKLKIDFKQSENNHFNLLMATAEAEILKRKL